MYLIVQSCYILSSAKCQNRSYKSIQQFKFSDDCFETVWPTWTYVVLNLYLKKTVSILELLKVEILLASDTRVILDGKQTMYSQDCEGFLCYTFHCLKNL